MLVEEPFVGRVGNTVTAVPVRYTNGYLGIGAGNPPDFFSKFDPLYPNLSPSQRKLRRTELLDKAKIHSAKYRAMPYIKYVSGIKH